MAGSFSDYLEAYILDRLFGTNGTPAVLVQYIGLYTATPSDSGGGTEVTGGSYARLEIEAATGRVWSAVTGTSPSLIDNTAEWAFVTATASWGTVSQFGIFDASTVGNLLVWGDLTTPKAVGNGDTAKFAAGDLDLTLD